MPTFKPHSKTKRKHSSSFSPLDLVHDSEEESDSRRRSSPRPRKSTPHKSPSVSSLDTSVVFQLTRTVSSTSLPLPPLNNFLRSKMICKQQSSILSTLREKIACARISRPVKRTREPCHIILPRRKITKTQQHESKEVNLPKKRKQKDDILQSPSPKRQKSDRSYSGRPYKPKGPCQACNDNSNGCVRKAFDWPFESQQLFNDEGKPYVYLCNKCGLRYNKSGGSVCRNCRWILCKEEKRKALQHIDSMRSNKAVTLDDDIEKFYCSPKYWVCNKPWKVGWVLNTLEESSS